MVSILQKLNISKVSREEKRKFKGSLGIKNESLFFPRHFRSIMFFVNQEYNVHPNV